MAFEEALYNLYDPRLKPRLLHSIMMSHLPDEKQLPRSPAQLSVAVAAIRRHHLLSEAPSSGTAGLSKGGDPRKGAVDAWVEHLMGLLCSTVAENRWAGLCLLGVTCQECSRHRFLEFYNSWFQKLLLSLKQATDPVFIRAASCASLTDLLTRLGTLVEYGGVRRDGAALIAKLVQPILQILGDKDSSGIWNEAIDLLSAILRCFPACLRQQSNNVESLVVARLMDADSPSLCQKCAQCLALLPRAHGDAAVWSSMIRRVLIAINTQLEYAFAGMEDVANAEDALANLLPLGQDAPWPLGGPSVAQATKSFWQQLVPVVGSLLQCCHYMLTSPFPVPVPVPTGPLLALAMRILRVDGSRLAIPPPLGAAVSSVHQVSLCAEIPALHLGALDLLNGVLCGVRSRLLPHAGDVVRLVSDYFRRCGGAAPILRVKLYDFSRHLFVAMGAGMASALAPAVVGSALADLKGSTNGASSGISPTAARTPRSAGSGWASGTWIGHTTASGHRKRKEPGGLPTEHHQTNGAPADATASAVEGAVTTAVQIAALRALEALLTSGGALLPERWRAEVDAVLANVAMGASTGTIGGNLIFDDDSACVEGNSPSSSSAFHVATYRALLASLLSPCCHRPPYLAQGLAIFRKGRQEAGTEVAEVSAHALLALEPLIHPRCLPPAGAIPAGLVTTRATSAGALALQMPRPGKPVAASGPMSGVQPHTAAISTNFGGPVAPPALKIGQLAMDPWAEVDTWLGYGEDFGENGLFYEDDMLVDDFNGGMDESGGGGDYYDTKQQNGQSNPVALKYAKAGVGEQVSARSPLDPFQSSRPAALEPVQTNEEAEGAPALAAPSTLGQDPRLGREPKQHQRDAEIPSPVGNESATSGSGPGRADCQSPATADIFFGSQMQSPSYDRDGSFRSKSGSPDVDAVETVPGLDKVEGEDATEHVDGSGPNLLAGTVPSMSGAETSAIPGFSLPDEGEGGSEDSDGVLPDIIDGDPDSD